ncbi:MAG: hypothetical protein EHM72_14165 [Calditrichaeota bacterium]|nr:MAG: hypothetical protein EHM72_14165 [Calditrichota bacterium]
MSLPDKTTSYLHWAKTTGEKRVSEDEVSSWLPFADAGIQPYPVDHAEASNHERTARLASIRLSENDTRSLQQMSQKLNVRFHEMLIASSACALTQWSGNEWAIFDLEGHGREIQESGIDISRTVGWFTTIFPVYLHIDRQLNTKDVVKLVSEQLAPFIEHSAGFQFARFPRFCDELSRQLEKVHRPSISFNYLGQFDGMLKDQRFRIASESTGFERHPENLRSYEIDLSARLVSGQLSIDIAYSSARYLESTVAQLAELIREALADLSQLDVSSPEEMTMKAIGVSADDVENVLDEMGLE